MSDPDTENYLSKLSDEASQTSWDGLHKWMANVSHDVNAVRIEFVEFKKEYNQDIDNLRIEIKHSKELLGIVVTSLGNWLSAKSQNQSKHKEEFPLLKFPFFNDKDRKN